ncbi:MAG: 4-hydroxyphenylacetate 3-hydroxylase N-terminal domain-containing protein [Dehalococcoidia bacterium]
MISSGEYRERLLRMRPNVYIDGERVSRDDPRLQPGVNVISVTYDLAQDPQYDGVLTATSHLSGEKISRFCHIHQSTDDLLNKQKMTRLCCQKTGGCIQRCMGIDAMNALSVITYDMDQALGTEYNKRFQKFLEYFQKNNICANCAQTDVKGDRSKRPHQQVDPDLYLRVVERKADGIIVRGAKAHNTIAPYADEIIALPTRFLTEEESDWAVAFAVPADTEGVHLISRPAAPRPRKRLEAPLATYGDVESLTVFDDVFVPWERVFMCGEREYGGQLALLFALYHRHSYTGCKPAVSDVLMGATALVAEYNGVAQAQHIRHKLADLISVAELVYAAGVAASVTGKRAPSGTYVPDVIYCNVGRRHAGLNIYHEHETLADVAGGLVATLPPEGDFYDEVTGPLLKKYMMRNPQISAENQHRCFRMIGDLICSGIGGVNQIAGLHGGGSPVMEEIAILGGYDLEAKKDIVRYLAGIPPGE